MIYFNINHSQFEYFRVMLRFYFNITLMRVFKFYKSFRQFPRHEVPRFIYIIIAKK